MNKLKVCLVLMVGLAFSVNAQYFTGDGLKGKSIAILPFEVIGLPEEQNILKDFLAGELSYVFNNYSAMDVPAREGALSTIYEEFAIGGYNSSEIDKMWEIMSNKIPQDFWVYGTVTKIGINYNINVEIIKKSDHMKVASYSGNTNIDELGNSVAIRQASLNLLERMGIALTTQAKTELSKASDSKKVEAQQKLAQGIVYQRQGFDDLAKASYDLAKQLDNSLLEATNRYSVVTASFSAGNIGESTRNKLLWHKDWVNRLTKVEQSFNQVFSENFVPYTLFYRAEVTEGEIDYKNGTQDFSTNTNLRSSGGMSWLSSVEKQLQQVYDELNATGMKQEWNLSNWPWTPVSGVKAFGDKTANFNIVAELLNDNGNVIGRTEFRHYGKWGFNWHGRPQIVIHTNDDREQIRFANVSADNIGVNFTVRIAGVNGMSAETAAQNGILQMVPMTKKEWEYSAPFKINEGMITSYRGNGGSLVIPDAIWKEIPTSIGAEVFSHKQLKSVRIPNAVKSIGEKAFANNDISQITIGEKVSMSENSFDNERKNSLIIGPKIYAPTFYRMYHFNGYDKSRVHRYEMQIPSENDCPNVEGLPRRAGTYTFTYQTVGGSNIYYWKCPEYTQKEVVNLIQQCDNYKKQKAEFYKTDEGKAEKKQINKSKALGVLGAITIIGGIVLLIILGD